MSTIRCTLKELQKGLEVPLDERTTIVVCPDAALATLLGRVFEPGRTFPLPRASRALSEVFSFAIRFDAKYALVVGHASTKDDDPVTSSDERAKILAAWLKGDPDPWLEQFGDGIAEEKRWGAREDRSLLRAILGPGTGASPAATSAPPSQGSSKPKDALVEQYQTLRGLNPDGIAGPITRKELINDYFKLSRSAKRADAPEGETDEPSVPFDVESHPAGANFPLTEVKKIRAGGDKSEARSTKASSDAASDEKAPTGTTPRTDETPSSDTEDAASEPSTTPADTDESEGDSPSDARVDFFFFMADSGIDPAPGSTDGPEYAEWIESAALFQQFTAGTDKDDDTTQLSLQLFDKTGLVRHASRKYEITGPEAFSGITDETGSLDHDFVAPGDYTIKVFLEFFEGSDKIVDELTASLVVLRGDRTAQIRMIGAVPRCDLARLTGLLFETNKAFLLPSAMEDLKKIRGIYEEHDPGELLVVGHTDTTGDASINDPLSLERAKSTLAYLEDDVDAWLSFYQTSVPQSRRWGSIEDEHMIRALPNFDAEAAGDNLVLWFQKTRLLEETGEANEETRTQLVKEYMLLDGAELDSGEFQIQGTAHGCGENFPVDDTGQELDSAAQDAKEDALDRRVELFFFEPEFGIVPKPPGPNSKRGSTQYPAWRKLAKLTHESKFGPSGDSILHYTLLSNSGAVPLANVAYSLSVGDTARRGATDEAGTLLETALAPGDYRVTLDGVDKVLPTLPKDTEAIPTEVRNYYLIPDSDLQEA